MNYTNENFGMMDEGYFVPRTEILGWINGLLKLNISKIEQLGSGSVYCQILDVIYPGKVPLNKVNWKAKNDYEFINNFRLLQNCFDKLGIKRRVEVEKLSKAKYQDNLEFIQWMKRYYDLNCGQRGANYEAEERRGGTKPNFSFAEKNVVKHIYNGGNVQEQNLSNANKPKKIVVEAEKSPTQVKKLPEKPTIRQKAYTVVVKPQSTNSQPISKGPSVVNSRKQQRTQVSAKELPKQPEYIVSKRIDQLQQALAAERRANQQSRNRMEEAMAAQLQEMSQKHSEYSRTMQKKLEGYKEKFDMVTDILQGKDSSDDKIKLIEEVIDIGI